MKITFKKRYVLGRYHTAEAYDIRLDGVTMGVIQQSSDRTWYWYTLRGQQYTSVGTGGMTIDEAKVAVKEWFKGDQRGTT